MKIKTTKYIFGLFVIIFALTSCDKEDGSNFDISKKADSKTINENIETLASLISQASENIKFRQLVKNEVGKQFDGDYDALLLTLIGKEISGEKFETMLANKSNGKYTSEQIIKMIKSSGYLQISIPVLFDEFTPETTIPVTVAVPLDINEKNVESFVAYDFKGNKTAISAKLTPDSAVFVIMKSERVDDDGNLAVDYDGFLIENKADRIHYSKAISQSSTLKKIRSGKTKIVNIVSDNEFNKIIANNEQENNERYKSKNSLNKVINATSSYLGTLLNVQAKAVQEIELNWQPMENSNTYEVYRTGPININGVKTYCQDILIYNLSNTLTKTDRVDYANEEYTYYIKYYDGSTYLGQPYPASAHSSHRKNNGLEYIKNVTVSSSTVVTLEGWWVSELELRCQFAYLNYNGELVANKDVIPTIPTSGSGAWSRYVNWTYGDTRGGKIPAGNGNLFTWDRQGYSYGAYSLILEEWDASDQKQENLDLWFDWVRYGLKLVGAKEVWSELADQVKKTITILDKPDYIGTTSIKWWDPNDYIRTVGTGFTITINHNSNNN